MVMVQVTFPVGIFGFVINVAPGRPYSTTRGNVVEYGRPGVLRNVGVLCARMCFGYACASAPVFAGS